VTTIPSIGRSVGRSVGRFDELLVGWSAVRRWRRRRMIICNRRGPAATIIILRDQRHTEDNARAHTHTHCTEYTYTGAHTHTRHSHTHWRTVRRGRAARAISDGRDPRDRAKTDGGVRLDRESSRGALASTCDVSRRSEYPSDDVNAADIIILLYCFCNNYM